jgi:hypothetical protein
LPPSGLIILVIVERNPGVRLKARFALAAKHPDHDAYERSDKDKKIDCPSHGTCLAIVLLRVCEPAAIGYVVRPEAASIRKPAIDGLPALKRCIEIDQRLGDNQRVRRAALKNRQWDGPAALQPASDEIWLGQRRRST